MMSYDNFMTCLTTCLNDNVNQGPDSVVEELLILVIGNLLCKL